MNLLIHDLAIAIELAAHEERSQDDDALDFATRPPYTIGRRAWRVPRIPLGLDADDRPARRHQP